MLHCHSVATEYMDAEKQGLSADVSTSPFTVGTECTLVPFVGCFLWAEEQSKYFPDTIVPPAGIKAVCCGSVGTTACKIHLAVEG